MLERIETRCLMTPGDVEPLDSRFRVAGTFNPAVVTFGNRTAIIVRVAEEVVERRDGYVSSPRYDPADGSLKIDWLPKEHCNTHDPRVTIDQRTGRCRLRFISYPRVFFSDDGMRIDEAGPVIRPQGIYETYGLEDPRMTLIEGRYYMTVVGVSQRGISTILFSTQDFQTFERHGIILAPDNKDVVLFPEKIGGRYMMMHRPMPSMALSLPQIWLASSDDLLRWGEHRCLLGGNDTISERVGGGTPPIRTDAGWLTIYHSHEMIERDGKQEQCYVGRTLLLDPNDPSKILAHSPNPIIAPEPSYERHGFFNNVVFPTAVIRRGSEYLVYNGAADENISVIRYDAKALEATLEPCG